MPADVLSKLEHLLWPRLNSLRDRLLNLHQTRNEITKLDKMHAALPMTYKHMAKMFPNSNKTVQKKFSINTLEKNGGNAALLMFSDNRAKEMQMSKRAG